jgi:hypothetical protein
MMAKGILIEMNNIAAQKAIQSSIEVLEYCSTYYEVKKQIITLIACFSYIYEHTLTSHLMSRHKKQVVWRNAYPASFQINDWK